MTTTTRPRAVAAVPAAESSSIARAPTGGLGLVLSGGGAPAAYFGAGVIRALERAGLEPRVLSGVSAGALNAAAYAAGMDAASIADMWRSIGWRDIYRPRRDLWNLVNIPNVLRPRANVVQYLFDAIGWTWTLDTAPTRRTFIRYLGDAELKIRDGVTLVVSSVDESSGEVVRFCSALPDHDSPRFRRVDLTVDHLLASAAVPMLFPPGRPDGQTAPATTFVDAGLVANTPLTPMMAYQPDAVVVVSGSGIARPAPTPTSLGSAIALLADNVASFALHADYAHTETVNTLARVAPEAVDKRYVPMLLIEPTELGFSVGGFLRFTPGDARTMMDYGEREGARALRGWAP
jgi:NTE family protein